MKKNIYTDINYWINLSATLLSTLWFVIIGVIAFSVV
jgi:hypothetical protein